MFALVLLAVVVGAVAQRITGLGFALLISPVFVLTLGAFDGVMIVNLCGSVSAALAWVLVRADVDWARFRQVIGPALLGIVPGAILSARLPEPVLETAVGALLIAALTVSVVLTRTPFTADGFGVRVTCGLFSGLMSAGVGVSGAAMSVYAIISRWQQNAFAATMQPFFLVMGATSLVGKLIASGGRLPALEWWQWGAIVALNAAGLLLGQVLAPHVSARLARGLVIVIAYAGGIATLANGLQALV